MQYNKDRMKAHKNSMRRQCPDWRLFDAVRKPNTSNSNLRRRKMLCTDIEEKLEMVSRRINIPVQISVWFSGEGIRDYLSRGNHIDITIKITRVIRC